MAVSTFFGGGVNMPGVQRTQQSVLNPMGIVGPTNMALMAPGGLQAAMDANQAGTRPFTADDLRTINSFMMEVQPAMLDPSQYIFNPAAGAGGVYGQGGLFQSYSGLTPQEEEFMAAFREKQRQLELAKETSTLGQFGRFAKTIGPIIAAPFIVAGMAGAAGAGAAAGETAAAGGAGAAGGIAGADAATGALSAIDSLTGAVASVPAGTTSVLGTSIGIPASVSPALSAAASPYAALGLGGAASSAFPAINALTRVDPFTGAVQSVPGGTTNIFGTPAGIPASVSPEIAASVSPSALVSGAVPGAATTAATAPWQTTLPAEFSTSMPVVPQLAEAGALAGEGLTPAEMINLGVSAPAANLGPAVSRITGDWWTTPGYSGDPFSTARQNSGDTMDWIRELLSPSNLLGAGASIYGAVAGGNAAREAANAQLLASLMAGQNADARTQPWYDAGVEALGRLRDLTEPGSQMDELFLDPGYQFRLQQGIDAINRSQAAKGSLKSGATLKKLVEYGQGVGSQEYGNAYNRLANLAGLGQTATAQSLPITSAAFQNAGNAQAAGTVGQQNAINDAITQLLNLISQNRLLNIIGA